MKKNNLTMNSTHNATSSSPSLENASGSPVSTSTKGSGGKNGTPLQGDAGEEVPAKGQGVYQLFLTLHGQNRPSADDLKRLRDQIVATPDSWPLFTAATDDNRVNIIKKLYGTEFLRTLALAEVDIRKQQLGYDKAPALERMHIDHLLTAWLRLRDAEIQFTHCMSGENVNAATVRFRQELLGSAQNRFLRAGEALERIRRLARNTPALQINIAHEGGKQVNVQEIKS
jgi:hypothetical protein